MSDLDPYELEILGAYESGKLGPPAGKTELLRIRAAAQATAVKDKRVNIRLSSVDLLSIQARALEEGLPYQTLMASVLHKYSTGTLVERERLATRRQPRAAGRVAPMPGKPLKPV